jgi:hypothetical protein
VCALETGLQHRNRRLIRMQHGSSQQSCLQRIYERLQSEAARADPLRQRRARKRKAGAAEDLFLAVQGQVVQVLRH